MEFNGHQLIDGKFYLWKVAKQQGTDVDLHSVYFVTKDDTTGNNRFFEVVFAKPNANTPLASGWYLVEKQLEPEIPEAEIISESSSESSSESPPDLGISVSDELNLTEKFGQ
jgi:hypothetical protein